MTLPAHVTPLRLSQRLSRAPVGGCPPDTARDLEWLGSEIEAVRPGTRRFLTDLTLPVRGGSHEVQFRKAAFVDIGPFKPTPDGCEAEVGWQSSSMAPLFPVFAGRLAIGRNEVVLDGFYAPPGGQFGAVLDHAFLNIAARGTARWFLQRVVAALVGELELSPEPRGAARASMPPARSDAHP